MKIRKTCVICGDTFSAKKNSPRTICSFECSAEKKRRFPRASHHNKAYDDEYKKRPEVKQRRKEYEKSEKRKKWVEAYKPRKKLLKQQRESLKKQTKITD